MDSWELLRRLVAAHPDDPLWRVLFERCEPLIRTALRSRPGGRRRPDLGLLDDLSQDVMERLLADGRKVLRRFAGKHNEAFEVYILRIAENILRDQLRRDAHRREVELLFPADEPWRLEAAAAGSPAAGVAGDPESAVTLRELNESVEAVLRRISLDDRQRALNRLLFDLYFRDHCSIPQIARLRAVPLSTSSVARRIALIRQALRTSFAARRHQPAPLPAAGWRGRRRKRRRSR